MRDIGLRAGEKVIDAKDFVSLSEQTFTKMRTKKAGAAGNENLLQFGLLSERRQPRNPFSYR